MPNYINKANQHEVYVQRFASYLRNQYSYKNLQEIYKLSRLILLDEGEITSLTQLNRVTNAIIKQVRPVTNEMWLNATGELEDFAVAEASFYANMIGTSAAVDLSVPVDSKLLSYINKSIMSLESGQSVNAGVWSDFTKANTDSVVKAYANQIKAGYANQESPNQITKRLRTISNGLLKNQAEALTRTGTSHYAIQARQAMANDNLDVLDRKKFDATFDNRTTIICMNYAGNIYKLNDPKAPVLPLHFNERSKWVYLVKGQTEIDGTKAAVGGKDSEKAEANYEKRKANLDKRRNNPDYDKKVSSKVKRKGNNDTAFTAGQISANTPMDDWMSRQPTWFIESSLGKERARMFIDGEVSLKGLSDATGKPLTLEQLKAKYG